MIWLLTVVFYLYTNYDDSNNLLSTKLSHITMKGKKRGKSVDDRKNNKKKYSLKTVVAVITIIAGITVIFYNFGLIPFQKLPDFELTENSTVVYYDENFNEMFQKTNIIITNNGDVKATDLTIDIIFPPEISIYNYTCEPTRNGFGGGNGYNYISFQFNSLERYHSIIITTNSKLKDDSANELPIQPDMIRIISSEKTKIFNEK